MGYPDLDELFKTPKDLKFTIGKERDGQEEGRLIDRWE